jgi:2-iminobutanoate/2-iminopropanoate deaminase
MNEHDRAVILNDRAPTPIGPYSQAVRQGGLIFVSGLLGLDPVTGELAGPDAASQARMILRHLTSILEVAGSSLPRVAKTTIFLTDLADFAEVNKIYAEAFPTDPPARSTIQVVALPKGARVEIEVVAAAPERAASGFGTALLG